LNLRLSSTWTAGTDVVTDKAVRSMEREGNQKRSDGDARSESFRIEAMIGITSEAVR
jgi:hypothetical protein